jgi:hypothetical protein
MTATQTEYINLIPYQFFDGDIQLTEIELFQDPPSQLALVCYTENGVSPELGLRIDLGKMCFLDIDPFEKRDGEAEGRERANALAQRLVKHLAELFAKPKSVGTHGD